MLVVTSFIGLLGRLNELINETHLEQGLVRGERSIGINCYYYHLIASKGYQMYLIH